MLLKLVLKGPVQSWGIQKIRGDYFPTDTKPTKSGITGLIGAVMGIERNDPKLDMLAESLSMSVIAHDNDGIMTDYHAINITKDRPQYLASGSRATGKDQLQSIITKRSYIQSGCFEVFIEGERPLLEEIRNAFLHPYWTPYLGRKCCTPSAPIIPEWTDVLPKEAKKIS